MKKPVIVILLIVVIAAASYFLITRQKEFFYNGTVEAVETDMSSRITGTIKKYYFEEGDIIKKGDLLVEIESKDLELAYDIANKDFNRAKELIKTATITNEKYDALKYKYEDAQTRLSWTKIISLTDGKVIYKFHEDGEFVSPGAKLITVYDNSSVDVNIYVEHDMLAKIRTGMEIKGYLPELANREFTGKISFINEKSEFTPRNVLTKSERSRLVYRVKINFKNTDDILKSGMTLEVKLPE